MEEDDDLTRRSAAYRNTLPLLHAPAKKVGKMAQDFWILPAQCLQVGVGWISSMVHVRYQYEFNLHVQLNNKVEIFAHENSNIPTSEKYLAVREAAFINFN